MTLPFFGFFMQHLARDVTEMAELQEEVTRAQAVAVMAEVIATQAESMAREKTVMLVTSHGEVIGRVGICHRR
jgi:xanthine/CO dehydrogenase XdhC/CoxF family maturation factor